MDILLFFASAVVATKATVMTAATYGRCRDKTPEVLETTGLTYQEILEQQMQHQHQRPQPSSDKPSSSTSSSDSSGGSEEPTITSELL